MQSVNTISMATKRPGKGTKFSVIISVKLLRSSKKKNFRDLNIKNITDKTFWKAIKPAFTNKCNIPSKIILVEEDSLLKDYKDIAKVMHDYFTDNTETLNIPKYISHELKEVLPSNSSISQIIEYYKDHPSILKIRENQKNTDFSFNSVSPTIIRTEIDSLTSNKATGSDNIPAKMLEIATNEINNILT